MVERMRSVLFVLRSDEGGATALEYGLILALISFTVIGWAAFVGTAVSDFFDAMANGL